MLNVGRRGQLEARVFGPGRNEARLAR